MNPGTTYYIKAYAINSIGPGFGNEVNFTTLNSGQIGTITDLDGNIYNIISVGTQTWMAENLKTTKFNDGSSIPEVTNGTTWQGLTTPGYCWYNNVSGKEMTSIQLASIIIKTS